MFSMQNLENTALKLSAGVTMVMNVKDAPRASVL
jgi:hypothetical protein